MDLTARERAALAAMLRKLIGDKTLTAPRLELLKSALVKLTTPNLKAPDRESREE